MFEFSILVFIAAIAVWSAVHDLKYKVLPNHLNLLIAISSLVYVCIAVPVIKTESVWMWLAIVVIHGALVVLPPYGLGGGDLKMIAALGITTSIAFVVVEWLLLSYGLAAIAGIYLRIRGNQQTLAFGPWLVTAWLVIFMGQ